MPKDKDYVSKRRALETLVRDSLEYEIRNALARGVEAGRNTGGRTDNAMTIISIRMATARIMKEFDEELDRVEQLGDE